MPTVDVVVKSNTKLSVRARQVCGMFDCPPDKKQELSWKANLPIESKPWNIGLIVGPSGSGKSVCARSLWPEQMAQRLEWSESSVIDNFPKTISIEDISAALNGVGFSTIPAWLRPFNVLSNGEQFRVDVARRLIEATGVVVIDEFTSVVDRQVASVACHSVQKQVRKNRQQFVAVSCHHDIIDWLQPDWTFEPATCQFEWRSLRRRPAIEIEVARLPFEAWQMFAPFHYLTGELNKCAQCFGLWANGSLASFVGIIHKPHPIAKNIKGISRAVTLPDWQGLGLIFHLMDTVAAAYKAKGFRMRMYPAHPQFVRAFRKEVWRCDKLPGKRTAPPKATSTVGANNHNQRPCAVFEFIGPAMSAAEAAELIGK